MNTRKLPMLLALFVLAGCSPKPDKSLILWEQPAPFIAAAAHATEIGGLWYTVAPTGSMEPFITGGDAIVVDTKFSWKDVTPGMVLVYKASWLPLGSPPVVHMAAAWSGEALIMSGIANEHYENSANGGLHLYKENYIGRVVRIYTKRVKQ